MNGNPATRKTGAQSSLLAWCVRIGSVVLIACVVIWIRGNLANRPAPLPEIQRVNLVSQAPAPTPEPPKPEPQQEQPQQPEPQETGALNSVPGLGAPGASPGPAGSGHLGLDTEAEGGSDSYGLAAKPGGREAFTVEEGPERAGTGRGFTGSLMMTAGQFAAQLQKSLQSALNANRELHHASYVVILDLWFGSNGALADVKVEQSSGEQGIDSRIRETVMAMPATLPPPPDFHQPARIRIRSAFPKES
jgi:hypothetical protein